MQSWYKVDALHQLCIEIMLLAAAFAHTELVVDRSR